MSDVGGIIQSGSTRRGRVSCKTEFPLAAAPGSDRPRHMQLHWVLLLVVKCRQPITNYHTIPWAGRGVSRLLLLTLSSG